MYEIKTIIDENQLMKVYYFITTLFYNDAKENNEQYYDMSDRLEEMKDILKIDNNFLMYIEDNNQIIAALIGKDLNKKDQKITMSIIAVDSKYRRKGIAKTLILEFEKRCLEKNIKHLELGSRIRACPLYLAMHYKPSLMIQVYNYPTIDDIKKKNKYNLKEISSWQGDNYGYIIYKTKEVKEEYIKWFEKNIKNSHAQYIFKKDL